MIKNGTIERCGRCEKEFYCKKYRKLLSKSVVYCSKICANKSIGESRRGIKRSKEETERIRKMNLGRKRSEETKRKLSESHKGKIGEKSSNWKGGIDSTYRRRNLDKYRFYQLRRNSRKSNNGGTHTQSQWEELKRKWNYMCLCCKKSEPEITLSEDHIVPISKGGNDDISNIQPLCRHCNYSKCANTINYINLWTALTK